MAGPECGHVPGREHSAASIDFYYPQSPHCVIKVRDRVRKSICSQTATKLDQACLMLLTQVTGFIVIQQVQSCTVILNIYIDVYNNFNLFDMVIH